mmetsp:Transcript_63795/g.180031  ORF Transcript_63795/g.180031 Transcript_63795/m.180031 type:complete len:247 (-) Transcript_63795:60-800(-)
MDDAHVASELQRTARRTHGRTAGGFATSANRSGPVLLKLLFHARGEVGFLLREALTQVDAGESSDDNVLAQLGNRLLEHLLDRLVLVLDPLLGQQGHLLVLFLQAPLDNLRLDCVGLALQVLLCHFDLALLGNGIRRHLAGRDADDGRVGRDLHGHIGGELLEDGVDGHEVGLAVDLDQNSDLVVEVNVSRDGALSGDVAGLLVGLGHALLLEPLHGLLHVTTGLHQSFLGVRNACATARAQLLDL